MPLQINKEMKESIIQSANKQIDNKCHSKITPNLSMN